MPVSILPLRRAHANALTKLFAAPEISNAFSPLGASQNAALERELAGLQRGVRQPFTILLGETAVGLCGASRQGKPVWERDIYYWLGVEHWGRGIMAQAVGMLLGAISLERDITTLTSLVLTQNPRSRRVLERHHFRLRRTFSATELDLPAFYGELVWELGRELK